MELHGEDYEQVMRVGGHPSRDSADEFVKIGHLKPANWMLLLEVESVGTMMWWDAGALQFYIRRQDLAAEEFSGVCDVVTSS